MKPKTKSHAYYIKIRVFNSIVAGLLVCIGALADGQISRAGIFLSIMAAFGVFLNGLRDLLNEEAVAHRVHPEILNFF